jgi:diacylglycerol kinase
MRLDPFRHAFVGIAHAIATQANMRIHLAISAVVIASGVWLGLTRLEWIAIVFSIGLVLQAELLNTAIEATVDKASPEHHPLAKVAKDCAAGAVLVTALAAVAIGVLVFGPHLLAFFG